MIVLIFRSSILLNEPFRLFRKATNSEAFATPSEETLGIGRREELVILGVDSAETPAAERGEVVAFLSATGSAGSGREARGILVFAVGSAGANELSLYWPWIRIAKTQSTTDKRIFLKGKDTRRDKAGQPLESINRFSSYTPRRMFWRILESFFPVKTEIMALCKIKSMGEEFDTKLN
jgi:hypothetical protein